MRVPSNAHTLGPTWIAFQHPPAHSARTQHLHPLPRALTIATRGRYPTCTPLAPPSARGAPPAPASSFTSTTASSRPAPHPPAGRVIHLDHSILTPCPTPAHRASRSPRPQDPHALPHTRPQGEYYACALSNVYTFGPTFRAEYSFTSRHLAEFWMIEPEIAFCDLEDDMVCAEDYVRYCCRFLLENCKWVRGCVGTACATAAASCTCVRGCVGTACATAAASCWRAALDCVGAAPPAWMAGLGNQLFVAEISKIPLWQEIMDHLLDPRQKPALRPARWWNWSCQPTNTLLESVAILLPPQSADPTLSSSTRWWTRRPSNGYNRSVRPGCMLARAGSNAPCALAACSHVRGATHPPSPPLAHLPVWLPWGGGSDEPQPPLPPLPTCLYGCLGAEAAMSLSPLSPPCPPACMAALGRRQR